MYLNVTFTSIFTETINYTVCCILFLYMYIFSYFNGKPIIQDTSQFKEVQDGLRNTRT